MNNEEIIDSDKKAVELARKMERMYTLLSQKNLSEENMMSFLLVEKRGQIAGFIKDVVSEYVQSEKGSQNLLDSSYLQSHVEEKKQNNPRNYIHFASSTNTKDGKIDSCYRVRFDEDTLEYFTQLYKDIHVAGCVIDLFPLRKPEDNALSYAQVSETFHNSCGVADMATGQFLSQILEREQHLHEKMRAQQTQEIAEAINPLTGYFHI